jgi:serine protease Do
LHVALWLGLILPAGAATLWTERPAVTQPPPSLQALNQELRQLTRALLPAVVSLRVHTQADDKAIPENHPPLPDNGAPIATGSGVIIRADGLLVTNAHVVEESTHIEVQLFTGEKTSATVLGRDPVGDLALLQIATDRPLPVAPLGRSNALEVGELVVAIGSPFGFEHTITFGIVSAKQRRFMRSGIVGGYIQTDASINTGNSGGPLVNMRGEVIGINTATVGRGELGFAIPIDAVKSILPQLHITGKVRRGWLGVQIRPLDPEKLQALGLAEPQGVYVHGVIEAQPAQQAGIMAGDVITRFDGTTIVTPTDLQSVVASTPVGKKVDVQLVRNKARHTVLLTVGEMPAR